VGGGGGGWRGGGGGGGGRGGGGGGGGGGAVTSEQMLQTPEAERDQTERGEGKGDHLASKLFKKKKIEGKKEK